MVLRQALRDLKREWSWALFYSIVSTMIAIAIVFLSISFSTVQNQSDSINTFIKNNVVMFQPKRLNMEPSVDVNENNYHTNEQGDLLKYLQSVFSVSGKAGAYVFVGNDGYVDPKYKQILVLFGQYCDLVGIKCDNIDLYTTNNNSEAIGQSLNLAGKELQVVGNVGADFSLFHPLYFIDSNNPILKDILILCAKDFKTVNEMFPWWRLSQEVFNRMILVNPSVSDITELQDIYFEQYDTIYTGLSTEEFMQTTTIASIKAHRLYFFFYVFAGLLLIILLIMNIIRMIKIHMVDYLVHHLYGAPIRVLQKRVGGFVLLLNLLPAVGIVFLLSKNGFVMWYSIIICLMVIVCVSLFSAAYAGRNIIDSSSLINLRRDY